MVRATKKDVEQARYMFIIGCFLLPWMWGLCYFHFKEKAQDPSNNGRELAKYTSRAFIGFSIALTLFITWIIIFQTTWQSWGRSLLINDPSVGGWGL